MARRWANRQAIGRNPRLVVWASTCSYACGSPLVKERSHMQSPDNVAYINLVDYILHERAKPFCYDDTCGCHDDPELISEVNHFVKNGLMTSAEATNFVAGKTI